MTAAHLLPPDVVCLGEAMVVLTPRDGRSLRDAAVFDRSVGGAELNVALTLARLGVRTGWLSRLGADGFGDHVLDVARAHGVVTAVERDPGRPTGLYVKDVRPARAAAAGSRMHYYRSGSAASAVSPAWAARADNLALLDRARVVHVSGITAALSASSAEAVAAVARRVADDPAGAGTRLTVDLNFRPALWQGRSTRPLVELAAAADEVLLGADEASALLGTDDPLRLAALLPGVRRVLLKRGGDDVVVVEGGAVVAQVPSLAVRVVEPVGAGDAFAAGYLAASCRGLGLVAAVRTGHLCAALSLGVLQDRPAHLPPWPEVLALVGADEPAWAATSVDGSEVRAPRPAGRRGAGNRGAERSGAGRPRVAP